MDSRVEVQAGICGFGTVAHVHSDDNQHVKFSVESNCEKIKAFGERLKSLGAIDAYAEIFPGGPSVLLSLAREMLPGCCSGCAVPVGLFKAMQVAAGLALPKDIHITLTRE